MNNEVKFDIRNIKLWYYHFRYSQYYPVAVPLAIISLSVVLFLFFIFPHIQNWQVINNEVSETKKRIQIIHQNTQLLQSADRATIDNDFSLASQALPPEKDFLGILSAISKSATLSHISLQDFNFSLDKSANNQLGRPTNNGYSPMQIILSVTGSNDNIVRFIQEIEQKLPIVSIDNIDFSTGRGQLTLNFYSKAFPQIRLKDAEPIGFITDNDKKILEKLQAWNQE